MSHNGPIPPDEPEEEKGFFENLKDSFNLSGDDGHAPSTRGRTKFFIAVNRGDTKTIVDMIEKDGFDPDTYHLGGMSALHQAVISGKIESVKTLLELGAQPDLPAKVMDKVTPMALAIEKGRTDIVHLLAKNGADIYRTGASGWTYAHQATEKNNPDMIRELIACGLDPRIASDGGITPLEMAVSRTKRAAAAALLSDARVAQSALDDKTSPLSMMIAEKGDLALTALFITAGFPPNFQDINGVTLLHVAALNNDLGMVKMLVGEGADINKCVTSLGNSPLHAAAASPENAANIIRHLIECGADPNAVNRQGQTPLHLSFTRSPAKSQIPLIMAMHDVNAIDGFGASPLHLLAANGGNRETAEALLESGADVNIHHRRSGKTALHLAVGNDNLWLTGLLLEAGANPMLRDADGHTPLYYARQRMDVDIIKSLERTIDEQRAEKMKQARRAGP